MARPDAKHAYDREHRSGREETDIINLSATAPSDASLGIRLRRRAVYRASKRSSSLPTIAIAGIVVAVLYFARDVFIPLALAILLSFVLGPLVTGLRRTRLGRTPSVIAVVLLAFLAIISLAALIGSQLTQLAEELPRYQYNIIQKIQSVKGLGAGGGVFSRTSDLLNQLGNELAKTTPSNESSAKPSSAPSRTPPSQTPLQVEIHEPAPTPMAIILNVVEPLLQPFAKAGIVIVFVFFFLLQREQLRDRFIRLVGTGDLRHTGEALDDAFRRLGRYLLTQTVINATFGLIFGVGSWVIGIPNPILWGAFVTLFRFVPYIGSAVAAFFPAVLAVAVDPGWSMLLWTAGLFLVVETVTGQIIEPFYYGRSTGLSAVAVVVATTFWAWLWGPIGLLLSMPLTLCLVVLGRHVAALEFLDILLGDEPALAVEEKFYQRMLAGDSGEAAFQAEAFLELNSLCAYYDEVAVKGLRLAQLDVNRGELDHERRVVIKDTVDAVVDDLSDHATPPADIDGGVDPGADGTVPNDGATSPAVASGWEHDAVLCIAGRGSLDAAVAGMLTQLLTKAGIGARVVANSAVSTANMAQLDATGVRLVCLSCLEPGDFTSARYLVRRLRRRLPDARIIAGFWTWNVADAHRREALDNTSADEVVTSLEQAVAVVSEAANVGSRHQEAARFDAVSPAG